VKVTVPVGVREPVGVTLRREAVGVSVGEESTVWVGIQVSETGGWTTVGRAVVGVQADEASSHRADSINMRFMLNNHIPFGLIYTSDNEVKKLV
jgi:hypothetical protein